MRLSYKGNKKYFIVEYFYDVKRKKLYHLGAFIKIV